MFHECLIPIIYGHDIKYIYIYIHTKYKIYIYSIYIYKHFKMSGDHSTNAVMYAFLKFNRKIFTFRSKLDDIMKFII